MAVILVVEDEPALRRLLGMVLEEAGYRVLRATHGRHALELLAGDRPDLVLADVMLPVLDGAALCRRLKADAATAAIPVILMSAAGDAAAQGAGADAFLRKPFDLDAVEALVRRWLAPRPLAPG